MQVGDSKLNDYREIMKFPKNGKCQGETCFSDLFALLFHLIATPVEQI